MVHLHINPSFKCYLQAASFSRVALKLQKTIHVVYNYLPFLTRVHGIWYVFMMTKKPRLLTSSCRLHPQLFS